MKKNLPVFEKKERIYFLDALRIFAFISVLIGHKFYDYVVNYANNVEAHETLRFIARALLPIFQGGGAGVVIFFLVSGYIIYHVLQSERTLEFLVKRIFRIYPLYILAVLIQYSPVFLAGQLPDIPNLIRQLLLIGDFFGTSYTLNGVEWTLRIEILFYLYMAILHKAGFLSKFIAFLPYIFIFTVALCSYLAPLPSEDIWSKGYITIYGPFLLLGSVIYMYEKRHCSSLILFVFALIVFYNYYHLIETYQTRWLGAHFAAIAFLIFVSFWLLKSKLKLGAIGLFLSDLTYAVYLFHNWFFDYTKDFLQKKNIAFLHPDIQALIVLFFVCYLSVILIEKPAIRLGRVFLKKIHKPRNIDAPQFKTSL